MRRFEEKLNESPLWKNDIFAIPEIVSFSLLTLFLLKSHGGGTSEEEEPIGVHLWSIRKDCFG